MTLEENGIFYTFNSAIAEREPFFRKYTYFIHSVKTGVTLKDRIVYCHSDLDFLNLLKRRYRRPDRASLQKGFHHDPT